MDAAHSPPRSADEEELRRENEKLREGLAEAQARNHELMETIDAIRLGAVDAIVVDEGGEYRAYTLEGANFPYRALVENIQEGALTLTADGVILYANAAFAAIRGRPLSDLLGTVLADHVAARDRPQFGALLEASRDSARRGEMDICSGKGSIPVQVSLTPITVNDETTISVVVTDRRQDYGRLRLLARMLDSVVDAVTAADPEGTIVYWNEAAERLYGWKASEMVGRSIIAPVEPGESEREARQVFGQLASGDTWAGEYVARHRDGHSFPVQATKAPVYDDDGTLIAVIGTSHDIGERIRDAAALRTSEERQALLAGVASALLSADEPQPLIDDLCRRALDVLDCDVFFNYLADDASGGLLLNAWGGIPTEEAERIRHLDYGAAVCGCVARDGCRIVAEAIPEHPDPRTDLVAGYGVRAYACHPLVAMGRTIGTVSFGTVSRDCFTADELATMKAIADLIAVAMQRIADRDALRASEARLRSVLDGSRDIIYRLNLVTGRFEYISPACEAVTGYTPDELMALDREASLAMIHPDDRRVLASTAELVEETGTGEAEYRQWTKDGEYRWLSNNMVLVRDEAGMPLYRTGNIRDITRRRAAEEALRRSNVELQRFAYVASHDLQEPLRSIVSFSQLLERRYRGKLDQDADEYIDFIVEGGNRMQRLIQDLLQVSRVETTAKPPAATDAGRAAADAVALLNGKIDETGATVTVGPMPRVMADAAQLEQVFANLIGNAIKYRRPEVPLEIRVSAERRDGWWEFSVKDNGIGIEAEYFDRIFEMFRRLHTHDQYEGTGIGLAVVKRIVDRHGGTIWVESTPDVGSTFFFTLPAV